jgi:hypothetical protein
MRLGGKEAIGVRSKQVSFLGIAIIPAFDFGLVGHL